MQDLLKAIEYLKNYGKALEDGVNKFVDALPVFTKQQIRRKAKIKLNSTFDSYMESVNIKMRDYVLIVELDQSNWIANAVESGVGQFDMKEGHLKSPKAKRSKAGYRYMRVPIGIQKDGKGSSTDSGKEFQKKINEVLMKPRYGVRKLKMLMNGSLQETQAVVSADPALQGMYRTRQFESSEDYHSGNKKPKWEFILFRTISENPMAQGKWQHPGIKPVHILKDTERWLESSVETLLDGFIEAEIATINQKITDGL
jgi:hypothetical protein